MSSTNCSEHPGKLDGNRMIADHFASVHARAYLEASDEVQAVIDSMSRIINDPSTDPEDRESALDTLVEALFPQMHEGELGLDLEGVKILPNDDTDTVDVKGDLVGEEATFAARLAAAMERQNVSQTELAAKIGVGQPAISMMLVRQCRPQKRTILKIAEALGVRPDELWPGFEP